MACDFDVVTFLSLGFERAALLARSDKLSSTFKVARCGTELPGLFKQWGTMERIPAYRNNGSDGIRVDIISITCAQKLKEIELPSYWQVFHRQPSAIEARTFCCLWVAERDAWIKESNFDDWLKTIGPVSCWITDRFSAYSQFVSSPALLTTSAVAELGIYVWRPVELLLADLPRVRPRDVRGFGRLMRALKADNRRTAGYLLDAGKIFQARGLVHRRRHHFDLATVVHCCAKTWVLDVASAVMFWDAVEFFLYSAGKYDWRYERVLFTFCQLFGDRYWPTKLEIYIEKEMLSLDDEGWLLACKQINTFVGRSFCIPFTTIRDDASLSFMYLHYTLGWSCDMDSENMKDTVLRVIQAKVRSNKYTVKGNEERYYALFAEGVRELIEPIVSKYAQRMMPWNEYVKTYGGGLSSGSSGKRIREHFGKGKAPSGSSRSYVAARLESEDWNFLPSEVYVELAVKFNEKAEQRHIMARDFAHHAREKWFWQLVANRGTLHGGDIGESPLEEVLRKLCLVKETKLGFLNPNDGFTLMDADYAKFDEEVECREKLIMQDVMLTILRKHAPPQCREDVELIGRYIISGELSQILRTSHFKEDRIKEEVDKVVAENSNVTWVSEDSVKIEQGNSQDSGTYWTLEGNTYISQGRMHVRDALLSKADRPVRSFNRSDDITESYDTWTAARRSYDAFTSLGLLFKAEKQRACHVSRVYFRDMYIDGKILGAPGRAVHSLSSKPDTKPTPVLELNKLAAVSDACARAARRGMEGIFLVYMYKDAENFYRKIRERTRNGRFIDHYVSRGAIRAPRQQGGYGILQPWELVYDWTKACGKKHLSEGADKLLVGLAARRRLPGVASWVQLSKSRFESATGMQVSGEVVSRFTLRNKIDRLAGDGSGMVQNIMSRQMREVLPTAPHRVRAEKPYVDMVADATALFNRLAEALSTEKLMHGAAMVVRDSDPPAAKGAMNAEYGGLGRECLRFAKGHEEKGEVIRAFLNGSITGRAFLEVWNNAKDGRSKEWSIGCWEAGLLVTMLPQYLLLPSLLRKDCKMCI